MSDTLVAATGSTTGNGYDTVLDALAAAITTAGTTLAELTVTVATTSAGTGASTPGTTPPPAPNIASLPADLLLKAKASNCAAVRSTTYRAFQFKPSDTTGAADPITATGTFSFDAATLTATNDDASIDVWTVAGNCIYTMNVGTGQSTITVSPAGVMVGRLFNASTGTYRMGMALPVQTIPVSELAGTWNLLGMMASGSAGTFGVDVGTVIVASSGAISGGRCFDDAIGTPEANGPARHGHHAGLPAQQQHDRRIERQFQRLHQPVDRSRTRPAPWRGPSRPRSIEVA